MHPSLPHAALTLSESLQAPPAAPEVYVDGETQQPWSVGALLPGRLRGRGRGRGLAWALRCVAVALLSLPLAAMAVVSNFEQAVAFEPPLSWVDDLYHVHAPYLTAGAIALFLLASALDRRGGVAWLVLTLFAISLWLVWWMLG